MYKNYLFKIAFISLIIIPLCNNIKAQEEFIPPPAKKITTIPFTQLTGGIIILKLQLDNFKDSLNFVLDTGSGGISLDSGTCSILNLTTEHSDRIVRGIAGMRYVDFAKGHSISFKGLKVDSLDFHINDYEILTSAYGIRIDGIIGFSFLRRFIVWINYDLNQIDIYEPGTFKYPRGGYLLKPQFTTLPMQMGTIKDNTTIETKFYFDTGAGLSLLLNDQIVADSSIIKKKRKLYDTEAEGLGGKKQMKMTVVKQFQIGPYKFRNVPTHIFYDEFNVTYPMLAGLIGNDLLRRFNVVLNYPQQQIFIKPNLHYGEPFDYSYTGLGMYLVEGVIIITDVIKGSPADEAGLKVDDIVIGVEDDFSNNIQAYKLLLQNARSHIRLIVMRDNKIELINMKVKSIF